MINITFHQRLIFLSMIIGLFLIGILGKLWFIMQSSVQSPLYENICYIHANPLKGKLATIDFHDNSFCIKPHQNNISITSGNNTVDLASDTPFKIKNADIFLFGNQKYRFHMVTHTTANTVICKQRVEDFIKTGSSSPFFFTINSPKARQRDLVILPADPDIVSIFSKCASQPINSGKRIAKILPPDDVFKKNQDTGYRFQTLVPKLIHFERNGERIPLETKKDYVLENGDILNFADVIRIQFFLQKQLITETVDLDKNEQQYLFHFQNNKYITRINRQHIGVFFKLIRLNESVTGTKHLNPAAWIEHIPHTNTSTPIKKVMLSSVTPTVLATPDTRFSLLRPVGDIPDHFLDVQTIQESEKLVENKTLFIKDSIIQSTPDLLKTKYASIRQSVKEWNRQVKSAGLLFWGNLAPIDNNPQWLVSCISRKSNQPTRQSNIIPTKWYYRQRSHHDSHDNDSPLRPVTLRPELIPDYITTYPPLSVKAQWIWDDLPWNEQDPEKETRFFQCIFQTPDQEFTDFMEWYLITPATMVNAWLNGKKIQFVPHQENKSIAPVWCAEIDSLLLKKNAANHLSFEIIRLPPQSSTIDIHPGLQVLIETGKEKISTQSPHWQASITQFVDWWNILPTRNSHWLSPTSLVRESADAKEKQLYCNNNIPNIPVLWINENKLHIKGKRTRYFRHPINISNFPENAKLSINASGPTDIYINGKSVINNQFRVDQMNVTKFLTKGLNYVYIRVTHPGHEKTIIPKNSTFEVTNDKLVRLSQKGLKRSNRFKIKDQRGTFIDRDEYSIPAIIVQEGDHLLEPLDRLPLYFSKQLPDYFTKDIVIINKAVDQALTIFSLRIGTQKSYGSIDFMMQPNQKPLYVLNNIIKGSTAWLYAPSPTLYSPDDPADFDDCPLTTGRKISNSWKSFFPMPGKTYPLLYGREHLLYRYGAEKKIKECFYYNGKSSFRTSQLIIVDQLQQMVHEIETDAPYDLYKQTQSPFSALRLIYDHGKFYLQNMSTKNALSLIIGSTIVKPGERLEVIDGQCIKFGNYSFSAAFNEKGLLATDMKVGKHRYYAPNMGLSHTIGHYYQSWHGLESAFNHILSKNGTIKLTIDDDLTRIARQELLRELSLILHKKRYGVSALRNEINNEIIKKSHPDVTARLTKQLRTRKRFKPVGALVVLNHKGEILAAISEPSVPMENKALYAAYQQADMNPEKSLLINRAIFEPSWSPGSSMKVLTAAAALEEKKNNPYVEKFISLKSPFNNTHKYYGGQSGHLERLKLPGGKKITTTLANHHGHPIVPSMKDISGALAKSYNVYFGYLALLMSRTVMFDSQSFHRKNAFWWRVFTEVNDRNTNFPLLGFAEKMGYNRYINLMPGQFDKEYQILLPERHIFSPLTTLPGIFPVNILDQVAITRSAIGQWQVRTTPLLGAMKALTIANRGKLFEPSLVKNITLSEAEATSLIYQLQSNSNQIMQAENTVQIQRGMRWVVYGKRQKSSNWLPTPYTFPKSKYGTATATFDDCKFKHLIHGKTGTSEAGVDGVEGNSWFIGYIHLPNGKIYSFAAAFPGAGGGNRHAGECIKRLLIRMQRYYQWEL